MRIIYSILFLSVCLSSFAQADPVISRSSSQGKYSLRDEPLIIIDGEQVKNGKWNNIDPNDLESVEILKTDSSFVHCHSLKAVILITSKKNILRKFLIKDAASGESIAGATVEFKSGKHRIMTTTNEKGFATADGLKKNMQYSLKVTVAGYHSFETDFKNISAAIPMEIPMEREIKECSEVEVVSYATIRCRNVTCTVSSICRGGWTIAGDSVTEKQFSARLYPNPAPRSGPVSIELDNKMPENVQIKIFSPDGKLLQSHPQKNAPAFARWTLPLNSRWVPGTYFVQITGHKGRSIRTEKLVIQ